MPLRLRATRRLRRWLTRGPGGEIFCGGLVAVVGAAGMDLAGEDFGFVHADIGVAHEACEIVGYVADGFAGVAPVEGYADLVELFAVDGQRLEARGHHGAGFD